MRCPKCGAEDQNTKFCGECGHQLIYNDPRPNRTKVVGSDIVSNNNLFGRKR